MNNNVLIVLKVAVRYDLKTKLLDCITNAYDMVSLTQSVKFVRSQTLITTELGDTIRIVSIIGEHDLEFLELLRGIQFSGWKLWSGSVPLSPGQTRIIESRMKL